MPNPTAAAPRDELGVAVLAVPRASFKRIEMRHDDQTGDGLN